MKIRINELNLLALGFIKKPNIIQDIYELVLLNNKYDNLYSYKSIILSECNDKGKGEYYCFIKQGETDDRYEDSIVTITNNMLYIEDLKKIIDVVKL